MVFKTATLVYKFLYTGFPRYFAPYLSSYTSSYSTRLSKVVAISLSFQSSTLLFSNLSSSLVIVLLLMLPLFGMLFQMRFMPLHPWPLSESSLNLPVHQSIPTLVWIIPWCSPWCLTPLLSMDTEIWSTVLLVLLRLRVLLYGEIKHYKSPIRIRICMDKK